MRWPRTSSARRRPPCPRRRGPPWRTPPRVEPLDSPCPLPPPVPNPGHPSATPLPAPPFPSVNGTRQDSMVHGADTACSVGAVLLRLGRTTSRRCAAATVPCHAVGVVAATDPES